jgi:hypothetical protein
MSRRLRVQYLLRYASSNTAESGGWRFIRVQIKDRPEAVVRTRAAAIPQIASGDKNMYYFPKTCRLRRASPVASLPVGRKQIYEENQMLHLGMSLGIDDLRRAIAPMQRFCFPAVTLLTVISFYPDVFACMVLTAARNRLSAFFPGNDSSVE